MSLPLPRSFNQRIGEVASVPGRDKLKTHIPNAFDRTKGTLKGFLIQMKTYHQFYTINLPYPNDKMQNVATFIKRDILE